MAGSFEVNIFTPERQFLSDTAQSLVCSGLDGEICILKDHMPMLFALDVGFIKIKKDGEWSVMMSDEGFAVVNRNVVDIFVGMCEKTSDIEQAKKEIILHRRREEESVREHKHNEITLARIVSQFRRRS